MGSHRVRWTPEEEASLKAGVEKYGVQKWRAILNDPQFHSTLCHRSNVDLKVGRKYKIAPEPTSPRSPKMMLLEGLKKESSKFGRDDIKIHSKAEVSGEWAHTATLKAEETAAAAAAGAVAEAEAAMEVAEAIARDVEEVEAYAKATQATFLALKNQNATKSVPKA